MPPDTPTPCSAKLIIAPHSSRGYALRALPEAIVKQGGNRAHRLGLVRTVDFQAHRGPDRCGQQHHGDDVARARPLALHDERDVGTEARSDLNDSGARAGVQSEPIGDCNDTSLHGSPPGIENQGVPSSSEVGVSYWSSISPDGSANLQSAQDRLTSGTISVPDDRARFSLQFRVRARAAVRKSLIDPRRNNRRSGRRSPPSRRL